MNCAVTGLCVCSSQSAYKPFCTTCTCFFCVNCNSLYTSLLQLRRFPSIHKLRRTFQFTRSQSGVHAARHCTCDTRFHAKSKTFPTAPPSAGSAAYCRSPSCGQRSNASEALDPPVVGLRSILLPPRTWHPQRPGSPLAESMSYLLFSSNGMPCILFSSVFHIYTSFVCVPDSRHYVRNFLRWFMFIIRLSSGSAQLTSSYIC